MFRFLFSTRGRLNRAPFWLGQLLLVALALGILVLAVAIAALGSLDSPGAHGGGGPATVAASIIAGLVGICGFLALAGSGVCLGIRRFHDRDKPGIWVVIQFVPLIGPLWYLIETGFLSGTRGPNRYGADPLDPSAPGTAMPPAIGPGVPAAQQGDTARPAVRAAGGRPGWVLPAMLALTLPGLLMVATGAVMAQRNHAWLASATVVTGRVVGLEPVTGSDDAGRETGRGTTRESWRAVIAAQTPDGEAFTLVDSWAVSPAPVIGTERRVAYDDSGPAHAVPVDGWTSYGWPGVLIGIATLFLVPWLLLTALVALLWKRRPAFPPRHA